MEPKDGVIYHPRKLNSLSEVQFIIFRYHMCKPLNYLGIGYLFFTHYTEMDLLPHTLLFFLLVAEGASELIQTQDPVRTMVGEDARFTCRLTQPKNVLQVTWQKQLPGGTEDVASYNKRFGTKINPPFQGKVDFEDTGLQNSTIVVRNVTRADQGCFRCLFNAYPEGAIFTKTCLIVDEQPEPTLLVTQPSGTELVVVSCSAVSRPALTVTLEVPTHPGSSNYSSVHSANADGTVTVSSSVTLQRFCSNATQVHCVLRLSSGLVKEVSSVIYTDRPDVCKTYEADQSGCVGMDSFAAAVTGVVGLLLITIIAIGLVVRLTKKEARPNHDSEMKQMPQTMIHETKEPCFSHPCT